MTGLLPPALFPNGHLFYTQARLPHTPTPTYPNNNVKEELIKE
jgi:hypothetical protein